MYVKAKNMYTGGNAATTWFIFHDFPGPRPNSTTFQVWKIWILNSVTFQDLYAPCFNTAENREIYQTGIVYMR